MVCGWMERDEALSLFRAFSRVELVDKEKQFHTIVAMK
jgi:hypothetical protein